MPVLFGGDSCGSNSIVIAQINVVISFNNHEDTRTQTHKAAQSEQQLQLSLEFPVLCVLRTDLAEVGRVDVQNRVIRLGMVQHVPGIETQLKALGFGQLDGLVEVRIETPPA